MPSIGLSNCAHKKLSAKTVQTNKSTGGGFKAVPSAAGLLCEAFPAQNVGEEHRKSFYTSQTFAWASLHRALHPPQSLFPPVPRVIITTGLRHCWTQCPALLILIVSPLPVPIPYNKKYMSPTTPSMVERPLPPGEPRFLAAEDTSIQIEW
jgi:hypothetical protein